MRENTERPITIELGTNHLLGLAPSAIASIPDLLNSATVACPPEIPGWDGHAAGRLAELMRRDLTGDDSSAESHASVGAGPSHVAS